MDRLLRYVRDIERATFFDIQNVCDYYLATREEDAWSSKDFTVAPPFDHFATRFTLPASMPAEYRGLDILTSFRLVDYVPRSPHGNLQVIGDDINTGPPRRVGKWQYEIVLCSALKTARPPITYFLCADEYGQIPQTATGPAFWVIEMPSRGVGIVPNTFVQISLLGLTFLNCRNVERLPAYPDPPKRRRGKKPAFDIRYHRLRVSAVGQKRETLPGPRSGQRRSLHIVRGHFRQYGMNGNKKLFGKWTGRYWVATHTAGDLTAGITTKDYEIERGA
jgi:hypothetical protein